jgi:hypothetical protein
MSSPPLPSLVMTAWAFSHRLIPNSSPGSWLPSECFCAFNLTATHASPAWTVVERTCLLLHRLTVIGDLAVIWDPHIRLSLNADTVRMDFLMARGDVIHTQTLVPLAPECFTTSEAAGESDQRVTIAALAYHNNMIRVKSWYFAKWFICWTWRTLTAVAADSYGPVELFEDEAVSTAPWAFSTQPCGYSLPGHNLGPHEY